MTHSVVERGAAPSRSGAREPEAPTGRHPAARLRPVAVAALTAAAALVAIHVALVWRVRPLWVEFGDDATYVLLARSLRSLAYRSIWFAGAPRHVQYPPGFPALLAASGAAFGERVAAFAAIQALLSASALGLVFAAVRRRWSLQLALLLLAACAVNPLLVASAASLLSETPFMALCTLSLWATARDEPSPRWLALAGTAALAAVLTRTAGVALVAALILAWASERRWRAAGLLLAAAAVVIGGWFLWSTTAPHDALHYTYGADLARGYGGAPLPSTVAPPDAAGAPAGGSALATAVHGVAGRIASYVGRIIPFALPEPTIPRTSVDNVAWLAFTLGFGVAGAWALWRRWRPAALFLVCYGAILAAWPWALDRLLSPALPLVLLALLAGIDLTARRWPGVLFERIVPLAFVGCVVAAAIVRDAMRLRGREACLAAASPGGPVCANPQLRSVFAAADFVRDHTSPNDTVLVFFGAGFYVRTGRVTLPITAATGGSVEGAGVGDDKYLVLTLNSFDERMRTESMRHLCDRFVPVRTFPPAAIVLRTKPSGVQSGGGATNPDACAAIDAFLSAPQP